MITRAVETRDWTKIAWLASDDVQEGDHKHIDINWVSNRKAECYTRISAVIEISGEVHAYCALERLTREDNLRAFIVLDWRGEYLSIANAVYAQLENMAASQKAEMIWMREMKNDTTLVSFVTSKGFSVDRQYTYHGLELVNLVKYC